MDDKRSNADRYLEQLYAEGHTSWVLLLAYTDEYLAPLWRNRTVGSKGDSPTNNHVLDVLASRKNGAFSLDLNAKYSHWLLRPIDLGGCIYLARKRYVQASNDTLPRLFIGLRTEEQRH